MFQLSGIIKNNPGDIPLLLKGIQGENPEKIVSVSPDAFERIKNLLHHS